MKTQAAIDQLLEPDTLDAIVENLAPEICKDNPTEECPAAVDAIIRQGLPLLAAAGDATAFGEVLFSFISVIFTTTRSVGTFVVTTILFQSWIYCEVISF